MPYHIQPLKYAIDNWHQLPNAVSNTDPTLRIRVSDFINSDIFQGVRIQVTHPQYGILFSCITNTSGRLVSWNPESGLTTSQILSALRQLGFDVIFKQNPQINSATREFLEGALASGYTHIRWAIKKRDSNRRTEAVGSNYHWCLGHRERVVVCFNENKRPGFLKQYIEPIENFGGDIMEVSPNKNPKLDFSWLDIPVHIDSVLTDNL